ncbi:signal peptidase I [Georgenia sp. EYE_87]|uniref:signal peptidase I n=1 Tax=Georgenia sp. EYE_87 TaxID=2853448 RepID=UPI0020037287|nr:signal peptidase I [Georgenia sp. EYE_87]
MTTDSTDGGAHRGDGAPGESGAMPPSYPPRAAPQRGRGRRPAPVGDAGTARRGGWFRETLTVLVSALVLSVLIKTFLAQAFYIPSGSMEDTLELGDRVMVNKLAPGPFELDRGDVVVFVDPNDWLGELPPDTRPAWQRTATELLTWIGLLPQDAGHHLIKRIVGVGGDTVECCDAEGRIMVNGEPVDEPYLKDGTAPSETDFAVTVPEDHVWLMGDNRSNSADSRAHLGDPGGGAVPVKNIVGRAFVLLWPADRITLLDNPEETFADVPEKAP